MLILTRAQIWCNTSVGAGAGLSWILTIGGQQSVAPSTSYGPPVISSLGGTIADAPTQGGASVTIYGTYLSVQQYLGAVTYGPSGIERTAQNCVVSSPHNAITCTMAEGTGRVLKWMVTVGGQQSVISRASSSYAAPTITSVVPGNCPTSGCPTVLGVPQRVTISGTNFGLNVKGAQLFIKINSNMLPRPAGWAAYRAALLGALPTSCPDCDSWLNSLYSTPGLNPTKVGAVESVSFVAPVGFGPADEVLVVVDGIPSDVNATFKYDAPVILNLAPNRANLTVSGTLNVIIDGTSFCASTECGRVLINGLAPIATLAWSDTQIVVVVTDPGSSAQPQAVQVVVGGVASNTSYFLKPVPFFSGRSQASHRVIAPVL